MKYTCTPVPDAAGTTGITPQ